jgi:hypothetical protein
MGKKLSRSAMKAAMADVTRLADEPDPLPEALAAHLEAFVPKRVKPADWGLARPPAVEILRRAPTTSVKTFEKLCPPVAELVSWALRHGHGPDWRAIMVHSLIDEWIRTATPHLSDDSRATTRSRLRTLASAVNAGIGAPPRPEPIGYQSIRPPYSPAEVSRIRAIATTQPHTVTGRQVALCVGCGLGAGLDSVDLRHFYGHQVDDCGEEGIRLRIEGHRPRVAWVRREWEALVRAGVAGVKPTQLLLGRQVEREGVASRIYDQAVVLGEPIELDQSRMRATWLVTLMREPIPLATIMRAAGLRSGRTLTDLLPFCSAGDEAAENKEAGA